MKPLTPIRPGTSKYNSIMNIPRDEISYEGALVSVPPGSIIGNDVILEKIVSEDGEIFFKDATKPLGTVYPARNIFPNRFMI